MRVASSLPGMENDLEERRKQKTKKEKKKINKRKWERLNGGKEERKF